MKLSKKILFLNLLFFNFIKCLEKSDKNKIDCDLLKEFAQEAISGWDAIGSPFRWDKKDNKTPFGHVQNIEIFLNQTQQLESRFAEDQSRIKYLQKLKFLIHKKCTKTESEDTIHQLNSWEAYFNLSTKRKKDYDDYVRRRQAFEKLIRS